jgi:hypothetical protein
VKIETSECHARISSGELEIVYVRYDEKADKFYCTLKPHWPLIPGMRSLPSTTMAALTRPQCEGK